MKAVLSNKIYIEVDRELEEKIKDTLTYKIENYINPTNPIIMKTFGTIRKGLMMMPIGRIDLIPKDYEIIDKRVLTNAEFPEFKGTLRASQQEIHDDVDDNCIINAKPGFGKTYLGLSIAGNLKQRTLVLVNTVPLRNQWAREIQKVYGFEPGVIGSGKFNIQPPIVVSNSQTLTNHMDKVCKEFGTIIHDEMHHASAPTFSNILDKSYARYKIGLSGTVKRKDGKDVVFRDYFGNKMYKPAQENVMQPEIHVINSGIVMPGGNQGWANRVTMLQESLVYRELVMTLAEKYRRLNHKTLIVSDRVSFLEECAKKRGVPFVTGSNEDEREDIIASISNDCNELWGTMSIFKEGIDQPHISCLIMAAAVNNEPLLEQLINRITRIAPGKQTPIGVDIRLGGSTGDRQFATRMGFYIKQGYKIIHL